MSIKKTLFGTLKDGSAVELYTITNKSGAHVSLQTLGAGIQSIFVPDKNGVLGDVVLGFDSPQPYTNPDLGYQGLVVGRYANRIKDAEFTIDGVKYSTPVNQGTWTLHGGGQMSFSLWSVESTDDNSVTFSYFSPDMQDGFPANFTMKVKYTFDDSNTLSIEYSVLADKKTIANPTNHVYFNLSSDSSKTIEEHTLQIDADFFTQTDSSQIPTGKLCSVKGTMMDFTTPHKIGERIDEPFEAVIEGIGYDNNFCLNHKLGELKLSATLLDEESKRQLDVYTDMVGLQVYCGGWLDKNNTLGKGDSRVSYRRGVALETQFYPDAIHHLDTFPFAFVEPNKEFKTTTKFKFSVG
jgi:aldose 1-epimerase